MALAVSKSPAASTTVGVLVPLKTPIVVETNEPAIYVGVGAGTLPAGISVEENTPVKFTINGVPTTVESQSAIKLKFETPAKTEPVETTAFKIVVAQAKFKPKETTEPMTVQEVDKLTGELFEHSFATGAEYATESVAEVNVLTSTSLAGLIERTN